MIYDQIFERVIEEIEAGDGVRPLVEFFDNLEFDIQCASLAESLSRGLLASYLLGIDQARGEKSASFAEPIDLGFDISPAEAIEYFKGKRVVTATAFDRLAEDARSAAFTVAGVYRTDILEGFKGEIVGALEKGTAQKQVVKRFREILAGAGHRQLGNFHLETVFRTNMQMAYGVGRRKGLEAVAEDLPQWTYHAVGDDRVRPTHAVLNGLTLPASHEFWSTHYPPWGFNCRCSVTAAEDVPPGYDHSNPSGEGTIYYDDRGMPAKAEIGTSVYDLAVGDFRGVPPQSGLKAVIEAGVERSGKLPAPIQSPGPVGPPVSKALSIEGRPTKAFRAVVSRTTEIIDSIHGDGNLPNLPVSTDASKRYLGAYYRDYSGRAVKIKVSKHGDHPDFTLAHELGHFIDHQGVKAGQFASEHHETFSEWRTVVNESRAVTDLRKLHQETRPYTTKRAYVEYLLSVREMWARSYSQYVAFKSGDSVLLRQLDSVRLTSAVKEVQWSDEDFKPIAAVIEKTLKALGWMR